MKLRVSAVFLFICCVALQRVDCRLPDFSPATPLLQVEVSESMPITPQRRNHTRRLPGLCRRLKRRRVTVLCNLDKFCWGRIQGRSHKAQSGQVCQCPRGSRCSHFFVHSL